MTDKLSNTTALRLSIQYGTMALCRLILLLEGSGQSGILFF